MFAADTQFDVRTGLSAELHSSFDQNTDTMLVKTSKRILFEDLGIIVGT